MQEQRCQKPSSCGAITKATGSRHEEKSEKSTGGSWGFCDGHLTWEKKSSIIEFFQPGFFLDGIAARFIGQLKLNISERPCKDTHLRQWVRFVEVPKLNLPPFRFGHSHPAGSIRYATCSEESDAVRIRREIGYKVRRVDHAIHVLLTAGMSTPALRDIARSVDIEHAAFAEMAGAAFLLGPFALECVALTLVHLFYYRCVGGHVFLVGVSLLSRVVLFVWLCCSHWDEQRFILKVMNKFLFLSMLLWQVVVSLYCCGLSVATLYSLWLLLTDPQLPSGAFFCFLLFSPFFFFGGGFEKGKQRSEADSLVPLATGIQSGSLFGRHAVDGCPGGARRGKPSRRIASPAGHFQQSRCPEGLLPLF